MVRRPESFISFVKARLEALDIGVLAFEKATGDRFRNLTDGRSLPPLAKLHRWAEALQLDRAGRLRLFELADEAHGGGTVLRWMIDELSALEKEADNRDRLIAKLSVKIDQIEKDMK